MATGNSYGITGGTTAQNPRFSSGTQNGAVSEREKLANFISMITRDETPFMSSIGKTKATGVYHEWQTDELAAPGNSRVFQGADFDAVLPDGRTTTGGDHGTGGGVPLTDEDRFRTRLGNYTQINAKTISVSNTKRAVDQAGVADEYAYQLKKRGTEMRRDVERDLIHGFDTSNPGSGTAAGRFGGYFSWINDERTCEYVGQDSGNARPFLPPTNPGRGTSVPTTVAPAAAAGRPTEFELFHLDAVMQKIYEEGGKANRMMTSPLNRRVFSSKAQLHSGDWDAGGGNSNVRRNIDGSGKLAQSVSMYMSDFGDIMIEPNYIMGLAVATANQPLANAAALVYDPQWFKIATLRPMQEVDVGQRGDSTVGMIVEECTLEVTNPLGCGAIFGIGGTV